MVTLELVNPRLDIIEAAPSEVGEVSFIGDDIPVLDTAVSTHPELFAVKEFARNILYKEKADFVAIRLEPASLGFAPFTLLMSFDFNKMGNLLVELGSSLEEIPLRKKIDGITTAQINTTLELDGDVFSKLAEFSQR